MNLSPVIVFVYNRPSHIRKVVNALSRNRLAATTELYIYADGPKSDSSETELMHIKTVTNYIKTVKGFKTVSIIQREKNIGLANSIITGVTEVINQHGKAIVLEDDIVPGSGFLQYMNEALALYAQDENVGCIHGWNYHLNTSGQRESTFFLKGADCWGWATWQRAWKLFNPDGEALLSSITSKHLEYAFNRRDTHDYLSLLKDQVAGKIDSWAIRWHATLFLQDMYCLHPTRSIVKNIGFDGSGVHCGIEYIQQKPVEKIRLRKIPVVDSEWFFKAFAQYKPHRQNKIIREARRLSNRFSHHYLKKLFPRQL